jgi:hypothetical protein
LKARAAREEAVRRQCCYLIKSLELNVNVNSRDRLVVDSHDFYDLLFTKSSQKQRFGSSCSAKSWVSKGLLLKMHKLSNHKTCRSNNKGAVHGDLCAVTSIIRCNVDDRLGGTAAFRVGAALCS